MLTFTLEWEKEAFPFWECLHGFWHTLPNFNPFTVTSGLGQDIAEGAKQQLLSKEMKKSDGDEDFDMYSPKPVELDLQNDVEQVRILSQQPILTSLLHRI